jgi:hypothetical protein
MPLMPFEPFEFFPVTRDKLTMLLQANTGNSADVDKLFDSDPVRSGEATLNYLPYE